jgi:hypothetical protein
MWGGGGNGCSCRCGGGGQCESCATETIARPKFFSGQLLTEDDLQLLGDYVAAKNRLHNRHLFGDGVVCGLEVTCHPCGGRDSGKINVTPGYALDCCGNDILVQCRQMLDINAMVRALQQERLGGFDCGDPCPPPKPASATPQISATGTPPLAPAGGVPLSGGLSSRYPGQPAPNEPENTEVAKARREYCLYVRYCESLTDPISPYATDDPCGPAACRETRVREGFRFELRCREEQRPPISVLSRICECFEDFPQFERTRQSLAAVGRYAQAISPGLHRIRTERPTPFTQGSIGELRRSLDNMSPTDPARAAAAEAKAPPKPAEPEAQPELEQRAELIRRVVDASRDTAALLARFMATEAREQRELEAKHEELDGLIKGATEALSSVRRTVEPRIDALPTTWEREYVRANLAEVERFAAAVSAGTPLDPAETQQLREGVILTKSLALRTSIDLEAIREWLLDRLDANPLITDCTLRRDLLAIVLPSPKQTGQKSDPDAQRFADAVKELEDAFQRYVLSCVCSAINPVCQPCDDPAVLLACLQVEGCDVIRVCSMDRKFVLTWPTMRYWLPVITEMGEALERLCCPLALCDDTTEEGDDGQRTLSLTGLAVGLLRSTLARACGTDYEPSRLSVVGQAVERRFRTARRPILELDRPPTSSPAAAAFVAAPISSQLKFELTRELQEHEARIDRKFAELRREMGEPQARAAPRRKREGPPEG